MIFFKKQNIKNTAGQSLIEVMVALAVGALFIGGAVAVIAVSLRISGQNEYAQTATNLNQELGDRIGIVARADWHSISSLATSTEYSLEESGNFLAVATGSEDIVIDSITYTRFFTVESVERDSANQITDSGTVDPSSLMVTLTTRWTQGPDTPEITMTRFIVRTGSEIFNQDDWVDGGGVAGPVTSVPDAFATSTNINYSATGTIIIDTLSSSGASSTGNIDTIDHWAWNDVIGWIDFKSTGTVVVSSTIMQGYASSSMGEMAFDCATSPDTDCTYSYSIDNDGNGTLSGWAWNDVIGWISFSSSTGASTYGVTIDTSTGIFSGWAWNDVIGWISFNCSNTSSCGTSDYKVKTSWGNTVSEGVLYSTIFDTEVDGGAAFNYLLWQGTLPTGTAVKLQLATSESDSGPWNYLGPDGTSGSYYQPAGPDIQVAIKREYHNNHRYARYRIVLESDVAKIQTPEVSNVIIGWSE
ncbi:MAG: prepilin-type N-terminal cleavage/methylation domain-containing protein [Candidatus Paceibacterota bacterium]